MGNFAPAWKRTSVNEGGWSNDPADPGGETYRGISRRWFQNWSGWKAVDDARHTGPLTSGRQRELFVQLDGAVQDFYLTRFWEPVRGDHLPQIIADEAFDSAVNLSPGKAIVFLQRSLNAIADGRWPDVAVDGDCGERTLAAVAECEVADDLWLLEAAMNDEQWAYYRSRMAANPALRRFARGWRARALARRAAPVMGEGVGVAGPPAAHL